jgi:hypothetical protein
MPLALAFAVAVALLSAAAGDPAGHGDAQRNARRY